MTITLVCLHGTGDTYLVCSLANAVRQHHGREVRLVVKESHKAICEMFDLDFSIDDARVQNAETNTGMHENYNNYSAFTRGGIVYCHPSFIRSGVRIDHLSAKPSITQADLYRAILHLSPDTPLMSGYTPTHAPKPDTVMILPEARSWPNTKRSFWIALAENLAQAGRKVTFNDTRWPRAKLLERCAESEWVIGPQYGMMAIMCHAQYPCRKTICTPSIDGKGLRGFPLQQTYPYAYVSKFAGFDYDIDEFKIGDDIDSVISCILGSKNFLRLGVYNPAPVLSTSIDVSAGELFDRLAILAVKLQMLPANKRALVLREYLRLTEIALPLTIRFPSLGDPIGRLTEANRDVWVANDLKVAASLNGQPVASHVDADQASLRRMKIKQEINIICASAFEEVKSFY